MKHKVKHRGQFIANYENALVEEARRRGVDGVVCGHIHYPQHKELEGILYYNDGDWVDNCTALVEHKSGELELLRWLDTTETVKPKMSGMISLAS